MTWVFIAAQLKTAVALQPLRLNSGLTVSEQTLHANAQWSLMQFFLVRCTQNDTDILTYFQHRSVTYIKRQDCVVSLYFHHFVSMLWIHLKVHSTLSSLTDSHKGRNIAYDKQQHTQCLISLIPLIIE